MNKKILAWLITFCALGLGGTAAYYSVIGLSKMFAGVSTAVIIMASFLEVSKLTLATMLHIYWGALSRISKLYYIVSLIILSLITSAGIYGMLSSGYQKTADQTSIVDSKIKSLESKKKLFEETRDNILKEKQSIANLQGTLSQASTTQYTDRKGNLVVRSNDAAIRNIESASKSNEKLSSKIDVVNDSIFAIENKILEVKTKSTAESELGPLKYLSQLTGIAMDRIINWYILVIIFVFDPLAIALVIAANFAFSQLIKRDKTPIEEKVDNLEEEMKEWEEASLTDLHILEKEEEEHNNPTPPPSDEWIIEDEEKAYTNLLQSLDRINNINSQNVDFLSKQRMIDAEVARLKEYERVLQEKRKNRQQDDDIITY
jgi:hypothetical protein